MSHNPASAHTDDDPPISVDYTSFHDESEPSTVSGDTCLPIGTSCIGETYGGSTSSKGTARFSRKVSHKTQFSPSVKNSDLRKDNYDPTPRWMRLLCPCIAKRRLRKFRLQQEWAQFNARQVEVIRRHQETLKKKVEEFDAYFAKEEKMAREERSDSRPFAYPVRLAIRRLDEAGASVASLSTVEFLQLELDYVEAQHRLDEIASGGDVDTADKMILPIGWSEMRLPGSNKRIWISPNGDETLSPPGEHLWILVSSKHNTYPKPLEEVQSPMV